MSYSSPSSSEKSSSPGSSSYYFVSTQEELVDWPSEDEKPVNAKQEMDRNPINGLKYPMVHSLNWGGVNYEQWTDALVADLTSELRQFSVNQTEHHTDRLYLANDSAHNMADTKKIEDRCKSPATSHSTMVSYSSAVGQTLQTFRFPIPDINDTNPEFERSVSQLGEEYICTADENQMEPTKIMQKSTLFGDPVYNSTLFQVSNESENTIPKLKGLNNGISRPNYSNTPVNTYEPFRYRRDNHQVWAHQGPHVVSRLSDSSTRSVNTRGDINQSLWPRRNRNTSSNSILHVFSGLDSNNNSIFDHSLQDVTDKSNTTNSSKSSTSRRRRRDTETMCGYCAALGEMKHAMSHTRDICDRLLLLAPCRICHAFGKDNHTETYCPQQKPLHLALNERYVQNADKRRSSRIRDFLSNKDYQFRDFFHRVPFMSFSDEGGQPRRRALSDNCNHSNSFNTNRRLPAQYKETNYYF